MYTIPNILCNKINVKYGRNNGKISTRHKGGGIKYLYTNIDFHYINYESSLAIILNFYIDYNRTSVIALILFLNGNLKGVKKLILSTRGTRIGNIISFTNKFPYRYGSVRFVNQFTIGCKIHSVEIYPNGGASIARSAGTTAKVMYHTQNYVCVKMPSGQLRLIHSKCKASMGQNSYLYLNKPLKAGESRKMNIRPSNKGVSMNPIDHPHGGGCGHSPIGLKSSKTPWGKYHYGVRTTKFKKSTKLIFKKIIYNYE